MTIGLAAQAASGCADAGFTVIYQDVILGAYLAGIVARLRSRRR